MGRGAARSALVPARARGSGARDRPGDGEGRSLHLRVQPLDAPRARQEGQAPLPGEAEAAVALEPARRDQGGLQRGPLRLGEAAPHPDRHGTHRHADDPGLGGQQPGRGLGPGGQYGCARADGRGGRARAPGGDRRRAAGAGHALRDPFEQFRRVAQGRSLLAVGAEPDRAALRRGPRTARGARTRDARASAGLAARRQGGGPHRQAARPQARAFRHLVQRLQAARRLHRGPTRRHRGQTLPDRGGVQGRHPEPARETRLSQGAGRLCGLAYRRGPGARLGPRLGRQDARPARTCARASRKMA